MRQLPWCYFMGVMDRWCFSSSHIHILPFPAPSQSIPMILAYEKNGSSTWERCVITKNGAQFLFFCCLYYERSLFYCYRTDRIVIYNSQIMWLNINTCSNITKMFFFEMLTLSSMLDNKTTAHIYIVNWQDLPKKPDPLWGYFPLPESTQYQRFLLLQKRKHFKSF